MSQNLWHRNRIEKSWIRIGAAAWLPLLVGAAIAVGQQPNDRQADQEQQDRPALQSREAQQNLKGRRERMKQSQQQRATLGVMLTPSLGGGVFVSAVQPDGPADKAGLRAGDYLLSVDDQQVSSPEEASQAVQNKKVGDKLKFTMWRNGAEREMQVELASWQNVGYRGGQESPQAWLGIGFSGQQTGQQTGQQSDPQGDQQQDGEQGVRITSIYPSGPAARSGLRIGDVMVQMGEQAVSKRSDVIEALQKRQPHQEMKIAVLRNGQRRDLQVRLGSRDEFFTGQFGQGEFGRGQYAQGDNGSGDSQTGFGEHAMMLEHNRRMAEQHQRIERVVGQVLDELQQLRREIDQLKNGAVGNRRDGEAADSPENRNPDRQ